MLEYILWSILFIVFGHIYILRIEVCKFQSYHSQNSNFLDRINGKYYL